MSVENEAHDTSEVAIFRFIWQMDGMHLEIKTNSINGVFGQSMEMELRNLKLRLLIHIIGYEVIWLPFGDILCNQRSVVDLSSKLIWQPFALILKRSRSFKIFIMFEKVVLFEFNLFNVRLEINRTLVIAIAHVICVGTVFRPVIAELRVIDNFGVRITTKECQ